MIAGCSHEEHFRREVKRMFTEEPESVHKWASEDYKEEKKG